MVKEWHTVSVRLNHEEKQAFDLVCDRKGYRKNHLLRMLVEQEIEPVLKPGTNPLGEGLPMIGEHRFKYNAEKDTFTWQLDMGEDKIDILAEDVKPSFLKRLKESIEKAIEEEEKTNSQLKGKKTRIPKGLKKYTRR